MPFKDPVIRKAYQDSHYRSNRSDRIASAKIWRDGHRDHVNAWTRKHRASIRVEVLTHYGRGRCACVDCGFDDVRALSIDHVNGNGAAERRLLGSNGRSVHFYRYLRNNGYPEGYETVCMNHQFIRRCILGVSTKAPTKLV